MNFNQPITEKFVTPYSCFLSYCLSPIQKSSRPRFVSERRTDNSSSKFSLAALAAAASVNIDTPVISRSSVREISPGETLVALNEPLNGRFANSVTMNDDDNSDYKYSSYFPVLFHRMVTEVAKVEPTFMRWSAEGSGVVIDYSLNDEKMSNIIQPYFKRK
jgi:hypothetical protein